MRIFRSCLISLCLVFGMACSMVETPTANPCDNVPCSNRGNCVLLNDQPTCACNDGYVADSVNGLSCVAVGSSVADAGVEQDGGVTPGVDANRPAADAGAVGADGGPPGTDAGVASADGGVVVADTGASVDAGGGSPAEPCQEAHCRGDDQTQEADGVVCVDDHFAFVPSTAGTPDLARYERVQEVPGEPVVTDALSELMWTGCPLGLSGQDCQNGTRQGHNSSSHSVACENLNWGGFNDWVRPAGLLTNSILDRRREQPTMDETLFPWITATGSGFMGLGVTRRSGHGPEVNLQSGGARYSNSTRSASLCVRSATGGVVSPQVRRCFHTTFGTAATPTTTDPSTGLQWQSCPAGLAGANCDSGSLNSMTWQAAEQYCDTLDWAGQQDWHVPSIDQFLSILAPSPAESNYAIDLPERLFNDIDEVFWTSTPRPFFGNAKFLAIRTRYGSITAGGNLGKVRCVRGDRWSNTISYPERVCRDMTPVGHAGLRSGQDMQLVRSESGSPGEFLVTDSYYGLQWTGCLLGLSGTQCEHGQARTIIAADIESACTTLQWGTHDDWRVASIDEVRSLFDYRVNTQPPIPAAVLAAFPELDGLQKLSGDGRYADGDKASYISNTGYLSAPSNNSRQVLCVRDHGQTRPRRVNRCLQTTAWSRAEGTVIDADNNLEWMACYGGVNGAGCSNGQRNSPRLNAASEACDELVWAGHNDWRLPDGNEVLTVFDASRMYRTKIDHRAFPYSDDTNDIFTGWTSSEGWSTTQRRGSFYSFLIGNRTNENQAYRCVRTHAGN